MLCAVLGTSMITGVSVSAKDKDELVLYTWDGMFPQEVLDDFEKETGTKVVYSNFDTDETMLEKLSQAKGGDYDVVIADDYIIDSAVKEGLVQKIDKDTVSNFKNINSLYQGQFYDPDDEYTVPYGAGIPLIVYDPEQVDIDIKGYKDLWDKSLEDSIAIVGNYRVICGITLASPLRRAFCVLSSWIIRMFGASSFSFSPVLSITDTSSSFMLSPMESCVMPQITR